ncbi:hypothetical protein CK203_052719 [Vitis vinifera]|uniref:Uncharacterized protein n=1 Tax=Vitis vinifera TaxID=29760 RepID=A0A438GCN8_VITVI|nr:hypothetical protein CK203_052719 [Vitis vinifera]
MVIHNLEKDALKLEGPSKWITAHIPCIAGKSYVRR